MRREAKQAGDGGIVLLITSELGTLPLTPGQHRDQAEERIEKLARAILAVCSDWPNVAAFAILDEIRVASPLPALPRLADPVSLSQTMKGLTLQRLLWVRNPHAPKPAPREARALFDLPF